MCDLRRASAYPGYPFATITTEELITLGLRASDLPGAVVLQTMEGVRIWRTHAQWPEMRATLQRARARWRRQVRA